MPDKFRLYHPQYRILTLDVGAEFFKCFHDKIHLGTRVETPRGAGAVLGGINGEVVVLHDKEDELSFYDKICGMKDLEDNGVSLSFFQPNHFYLQVYANFNPIKIDAGNAVFKAFDYQIKLGSRVNAPGSLNKKSTAIVLGCTEQGELVMQTDNSMFATIFAGITNLHQLFDNGFDILPLKLEDMVINAIKKNPSAIIRGIQCGSKNRVLPQDFFNRIQTVLQKKDTYKKVPDLYAALQQQALVTAVVELQNEVQILKATCQELIKQNQCLQEQLNEKINSEKNGNKSYRNSIF